MLQQPYPLLPCCRSPVGLRSTDRPRLQIDPRFTPIRTQHDSRSRPVGHALDHDRPCSCSVRILIPRLVVVCFVHATTLRVRLLDGRDEVVGWPEPLGRAVAGGQGPVVPPGLRSGRRGTDGRAEGTGSGVGSTPLPLPHSFPLHWYMRCTSPQLHPRSTPDRPRLIPETPASNRHQLQVGRLGFKSTRCRPRVASNRVWA